MPLENRTTITEFILLGLSSDPNIEVLLFVLFLMIYIQTLMGNLVMLVVISADAHLHTPMYFFLSHLSFLDLCFSSATVPKMLENLLSQRKTISVKGCLAQVFFVFGAGAIEASLLSVMAYDRYVAICHPLLYGQKMSQNLCIGLALGAWCVGSIYALLNSLLAMRLDFCGDQSIPHYSCELPSLFPLSCSDVSINFTVLLCSALFHGFATSFMIGFSYTLIISTILNISSSSGRSKTFSTCSSHLTAVLLFYGSAFLRHFLPSSGSTVEMITSVMYSVVTPLLNPLIYSLKSKEVKAALNRTFKNISNILSS